MSDADRPPFLGPERPAGEGVCVHSPHNGTWTELCGKDAVWHIMWTATGESSPCCNHHRHNCHLVKYAVQVHALLPDCTMPGAVWYPAEGVCRWEPEITDEPPARKVEKELVLV